MLSPRSVAISSVIDVSMRAWRRLISVEWPNLAAECIGVHLSLSAIDQSAPYCNSITVVYEHAVVMDKKLGD